MRLDPVIVKTYKGSESSANEKYQIDASEMASRGYYPTSQSWAPGSYGCGSFIAALLLCIILIGFIIFVYMLLVKPQGTLSVTYAFTEPVPTPRSAQPGAEKTCPECAEQVKAAAKVCRFCGHQFE